MVDESGDLEAEECADDNWSIVEAVEELDKRLSASPPKIAETEEHRQNESPKMDVSNESSNDESEVTVVAKNDAPKNDAPKNTTENVVSENDVDENVTKNDLAQNLAQNLAQFFESGKSFSCGGFTLTSVSNKPSTSKDVNHPVFFQAFK